MFHLRILISVNMEWNFNAEVEIQCRQFPTLLSLFNTNASDSLTHYVQTSS